jgi:GNAT superfamily N-acetyltransferase
MKQADVNFSIQTVKTDEQLQQVWSFAVPILDLPTGKHTLAYYTEHLAQTPTLLVYAVQAERVCGCCLASLEEDHVLVGPVAVAEDMRRMGVGSVMLWEVEAQAKKLGQTTLILGAVEEAEPFYLRCGYQPNLFVQLPEESAVTRLGAINPGYEVVWQEERDGWTRIMLHTPRIDKGLQRQYEKVFPGCYTQAVFVKTI